MLDGTGASVDWHTMAVTAREAPWTTGTTVTLMLVTTLLPTALHLLLAVFAAVIQVFQNERFRGLLRDPFAKLQEDQKGSFVQIFGAASWLSFNVLVSGGLIVGVGYLLLGVPHVPLGNLLYGLVAWVYGV